MEKVSFRFVSPIAEVSFCRFFNMDGSAKNNVKAVNAKYSRD